MNLKLIFKNNILFYFLFCYNIFSICVSNEIKDQVDALDYLARFGYVEKTVVNDMNLVDARPFLKEFQKMVGINQTGQLDKETMTMMNMPRCGNMDLAAPMTVGQKSPRLRRYSANGQKWHKRDLTYRITQYSNAMTVDRESVERDIAKAFQLWQSVTNLNFRKASEDEPIDIEIHFATKQHSDSYPFDGPGVTLAHAFAPGRGIGGDVHFDDHEEWTVDTRKGTNVLFVALHEIGHSLGLSHSLVRGSIMRATYGGYNPDLQLHQDDIDGIQSLYGPREESNEIEPFPSPTRPKITTTETTSTTTTTTMRSTEDDDNEVRDRVLDEDHFRSRFGSAVDLPKIGPTRTRVLRANLCDDPKIDAAWTTDNQINVFKGSYLYGIDPLGRRGVIRGPSRIESIYKELDTPLDACFTRKRTGYTYCFKGDQYWRFSKTKMSKGYPRDMDINFRGIPHNIDAAFESPNDAKFYFFKGDKFWTFDPKFPKDSTDPLPIEMLGLKVDSVDAAFVHPINNRIYVFKNELYWRFEDRQLKVLETEPPYPRQSRLMWFKCTAYTPELDQI